MVGDDGGGWKTRTRDGWVVEMRSVAPGKIIVTGEYAGVFGEPVTLAAIDRYTSVKVSRRGSNVIEAKTSLYPGEKMSLTISQAREWWREAENDWNMYRKTGNKESLLKYREGKLTPLKLAVAAAITEGGGMEGGVIEVSSTLPVGSGLGSSASMCVGVVGALVRKWDREEINKLAYRIERVFNGSPSGADNTAISYGGWLRFQREGEDKLLVNEIKARTLKENWWLVDGGKPDENSLELIEKVLELGKQKPKLLKELLARDRVVTELVQKELKRGKLRPDFLKESQAVLEQMGVIGERGINLIKGLEKIGGYAKVSGAGGVRGGAGSIVAYVEDKEKLEYLSRKKQFKYQRIVLGVEGWKRVSE